MSGTFKPQPLPEDLTAALRAGVQDIPKTVARASGEPPTALSPIANPVLLDAASQVEAPDPPLRATPPDDIAKRFTSFRLPVALDEDLRAMMFETRRSKQDLLIEFVTEGVRAWRRERTKRG
jgi:hypothetical protein